MGLDLANVASIVCRIPGSYSCGAPLVFLNCLMVLETLPLHCDIDERDGPDPSDVVATVRWATPHENRGPQPPRW